MPTYEVEITTISKQKFYLAAESEGEIHEFLEDNEDWVPDDVAGLVDYEFEDEIGLRVKPEDSITADFALFGGVIDSIA